MDALSYMEALENFKGRPKTDYIKGRMRDFGVRVGGEGYDPGTDTYMKKMMNAGIYSKPSDLPRKGKMSESEQQRASLVSGLGPRGSGRQLSDLVDMFGPQAQQAVNVPNMLLEALRARLSPKKAADSDTENPGLDGSSEIQADMLFP